MKAKAVTWSRRLLDTMLHFSSGPYRSKIFSSFLCSNSAGKLNTAMVLDAGDLDLDRRPRDLDLSRRPRDRDLSRRPPERDRSRLAERDRLRSSRRRSSGDGDRRDDFTGDRERFRSSRDRDRRDSFARDRDRERRAESFRSLFDRELLSFFADLDLDRLRSRRPREDLSRDKLRDTLRLISLC